MCREGDDYEVLLDGEDISANLTEVNSSVSRMGDVLIERSDNNTVLTSFDSGFSARVQSTAQNIPDLTLSLPRNSSLEGQIRGLLGNGNGNDTDDLIFQNGTTISTNSSDRMIHEFGQSCKFGK